MFDGHVAREALRLVEQPVVLGYVIAGVGEQITKVKRHASDQPRACTIKDMRSGSVVDGSLNEQIE